MLALSLILRQDSISSVDIKRGHEMKFETVILIGLVGGWILALGIVEFIAQ